MRKSNSDRTKDTARLPARRSVAAARNARSTEADSFGSVPVGTSAFAGSAWSFDGVIRRVLGFSRAAGMAEGAAPARRGGAKHKAKRATDGQAAFDALALFVRALDQETRNKLQTLMRAGSDGRGLADAHDVLTKERATPGYETPELFREGAVSLENLQRGHAVACATRFDLEKKLSSWVPPEGRSPLDDRVWLRFGRELAVSDPEEWSCLAQMNSDKELEALYLRRGEKRWWSFDALIDRPSGWQIAKRRNARSPAQARLVSLPVEALVGRSHSNGREAVRRAALAVSARLGRPRMASNESGRSAPRAGARSATGT
jgi:hypothetical protein